MLSSSFLLKLPNEMTSIEKKKKKKTKILGYLEVNS